MSVTVRRSLLTLHQWIGIFAAMFLIVAGVTGSALVFEAEIDRALNPATSHVTPRGQRMPIETLVARVLAAAPKDVDTGMPKGAVTGIRIAEKPDIADEVLLESGLVAMVDPYTGTVLGVRDRDTSFARQLHLLHTSLLADDF